MALTILAVTFFGFLVLGVPVAFAIGLSALCTILYEGLPVAVIFQQMMSGMNIFSFLAIPFFVFSGELMLYGGIADKIVAAARATVGHIRGGLWFNQGILANSRASFQINQIGYDGTVTDFDDFTSPQGDRNVFEGGWQLSSEDPLQFRVVQPGVPEPITAGLSFLAIGALGSYVTARRRKA